MANVLERGALVAEEAAAALALVAMARALVGALALVVKDCLDCRAHKAQMVVMDEVAQET